MKSIAINCAVWLMIGVVGTLGVQEMRGPERGKTPQNATYRCEFEPKPDSKAIYWYRVDVFPLDGNEPATDGELSIYTACYTQSDTTGRGTEELHCAVDPGYHEASY